MNFLPFFSYLRLALLKKKKKKDWKKKKRFNCFAPLCLLICKTVFSWVLVIGLVVLWGLKILDSRPWRTALFLTQYSGQFLNYLPTSPLLPLTPFFFLISRSYSNSAPLCVITSTHNFFAETFQLPSHSVCSPPDTVCSDTVFVNDWVGLLKKMPIGARREERGQKDLTHTKKSWTKKRKDWGPELPLRIPPNSQVLSLLRILHRGLYRAEVATDWIAKPGYSWRHL